MDKHFLDNAEYYVIAHTDSGELSEKLTIDKLYEYFKQKILNDIVVEQQEFSRKDALGSVVVDKKINLKQR